ncbi:hypothetical protein [Psychroserpens ponticola]|uniref:DUF4384 domain-containing protein n=1 Tax=Psychroserpens ponticola TaxID=2932268 RepID=A0ABY7RZG5_9FLAO|nr:hypothetical protein [Psychroserpens ponticola]WCO02061.1 hypothetical protein MUN68_000905 [Psychroserpens ponticola]
MKTSHILFIALLFPVISAFPQQELIGGQAIGGSRVNLLIDVTPVVLNESVEGSPYINEKYLPATISASEGDVFYVRYNALNDIFEVKGDKNKAYSLNRYRRDIVIEMLNLNKTYQVLGYYDDEKNENFGYFLYLSNPNPKTILFKKEKITFIDEQKASTGYDSSKPAKYKRLNDKFFIKLEDEKILSELPSNKKAIAKLFPNHQDKVLKFIKENRIKTSKEDDLVQLINYINTL